jgi:hypothetical protein
MFLGFNPEILSRYDEVTTKEVIRKLRRNDIITPPKA